MGPNKFRLAVRFVVGIDDLAMIHVYDLGDGSSLDTRFGEDLREAILRQSVLFLLPCDSV